MKVLGIVSLTIVSMTVIVFHLQVDNFQALRIEDGEKMIRQGPTLEDGEERCIGGTILTRIACHQKNILLETFRHIGNRVLAFLSPHRMKKWFFLWPSLLETWVV